MGLRNAVVRKLAAEASHLIAAPGTLRPGRTLSRRDRRRPESDLVCLRFLQVEVAFEIPKHLIVDPSVVAKSQQGAPLHAKQLVRQRSGLAVLPWRLCCVIRRSGQGLESFAIMLGQIVVQACILGPVVATRFFQVIESGL